MLTTGAYVRRSLRLARGQHHLIALAMVFLVRHSCSHPLTHPLTHPPSMACRARCEEVRHR